MPQLALAPASLRRPGFPWTGRCTARVSASELRGQRARNHIDLRYVLIHTNKLLPVYNCTISDTKTTVIPPFWRFPKAMWLKNTLNVVYSVFQAASITMGIQA
uniref:Uncharacterized protein n=1 Tax=Escherichia coli TaxID=562 RepID=A0A6H0A050_ECOLX|nr:hypothetical protein [Escherichia coli]UMW92816.1 hypothetical protein [Escherichia coli]